VELGTQRSEIASVNFLDIIHGLTIILILQESPQEGHEVVQAARTLFTNTSCPRYNVLIRAVEEVKVFMQRVPANMHDVQSEFRMAYKGTVAEKKLEAKEKLEKPTLNVTDIDDHHYY